jgi:hypothetical protein
MNYLKNSILIMFLCLVTSCEKEINWKIKKDNQDVLIVDGIITNEFKSQYIKLSHSYQELNSSASPFTGAIVYLSDSITIYKFTEAQNDPGNYFSIPFRALTGKKYYLTIQTDSISYAAAGSAVPVTPMNKINIVKSDEVDLYTFIYSESSSPSMTEVYYDWSSVPDYCNSYGYCSAAETYYTLDNFDISEAFKPDKQIIKFPSGTTIIRKTYGLTEEHQEFLRSLLMETEWRGGLFDVQTGNVNTNISNGAKGFFAVCMVVSDTTVIQ